MWMRCRWAWAVSIPGDRPRWRNICCIRRNAALPSPFVRLRTGCYSGFGSAVPPRLTPLPSTKTPFLVDELFFAFRHPPKRLFWWMSRLSEKITMPNYRRWRRKCQSTIPTVTLTLRECLVPHWGISNDRSEASTTSWPTPSTSLPKTMA